MVKRMGKEKDKAQDQVLGILTDIRIEQLHTQQAIRKLSAKAKAAPKKIKKKVKKRRRGLSLALLLVAAVFAGYLFFPDLLPSLGAEWLIIGAGLAVVATVLYSRRGFPVIGVILGVVVVYFLLSGEELLPWFARIWPMVPGGLTGWSVLILAFVTLIVLSHRGALKGQGEGIQGIIWNLFNFRLRLGGLKIVVVVIVFVAAWMWFLEISASDLLVDRWYIVNPRILEAVVPALIISILLDFLIKSRKQKAD